LIYLFLVKIINLFLSEDVLKNIREGELDKILSAEFVIEISNYLCLE